MKAESVDISTLTCDPANVRKHGDRNLATIKASLQRFGQQKPIVVDADGVVRAGNGTLEAARALGWAKIDIVRTALKGSDATAYAIADNRTAELAEWDDDDLAKVLASLQIEDEELAKATGFSDKDIEALVNSTTGAGEIVEDEAPEPPADPITKPGDLWLLGEHRVLCGDSTKAKDVARVMGGEKAGVCFTSPPYNADTKAGDGDIFNGRKSKKLYAEEYGDNRSSSDYVEFARDALRLCFEHVDGFIFWNVSYNKNARFEYIEQITPWLPHLVEQICWKKHSAIPFKGSMRRAWEPIYLFSTSRATLGLDRVESNFWDVSNTGSQADNHKACFPVALPAKAIELINGADTVYEPFCGSGTTLIAAEQLHRRCFGIEIAPAYCDVIVKRWENLTGNKAQRQAAAGVVANG